MTSTLAHPSYKELRSRASQHLQAASKRTGRRELPFSVYFTKRAIDIAISGMTLLLACWLFPILALLIRLDSPGPIIYRQRRVKRILARNTHGQLEFELFDMLKFRTMRNDAEKHTGAVLASQNDPRVTRIGAFLRKTRLDELPQLWSVLRGDMTLVGPRPERPELFTNLAMAIPFFEERMRGIKPGITGLAQVSLGYTGRAIPGTEVEAYEPEIINPFSIDELGEGSPADDMRMKLLFDLAYVAAGRFDVFFETGLSPWDVAAGSLLVEEGGGRVTDFRDSRSALFASQVLATNKLVHAEMLELVSPLRDARG